MKKQLQYIIIEDYGVSEKDLIEVESSVRENGRNTGEVLLDKKLLTEHQLLEVYSRLYDIPFWPELSLENPATDFTKNISIQFLKKYNIVPLERVQEAEKNRTDNKKDSMSSGTVISECIIAVNDPIVFQPVDDILKIIRPENYKIVLSTKAAILSAINISYDLARDSAEKLVRNLEENDGFVISEFEDTADLLDDTSDAPIIKLVNHILSQSIKARASDIHIESYQDSFKIRYRVDGILYDFLTPPKWIQPALISRIKVMAKMDIAEKRLPQDGRLDVKIGDQEIDVRVSTIPVTFGERVVLRLLNKSGSLLTLEDIGLSSERLDLLKKIVASPNGILLVTGPTGSGKTTTLYAVLTSINSSGINIITIEDPVEYQIKGISQIQVNPKIDLTFANGLRSIVRQDPDVILIGEIRDMETAGIAVQSALTGHLVLSTLHTNDAASAITRLVDMGVEPFLISSSVIAVIAQRLIRVLCSNCKEAYVPDDIILKSIGITDAQIKDHTIYRAKGCGECFNTGYRGRLGIFEIMIMEGDLKSLILKTYDANLIKEAALKQNMITLREDGIQMVLNGISTIEEILRVTQ